MPHGYSLEGFQSRYLNVVAVNMPTCRHLHREDVNGLDVYSFLLSWQEDWPLKGRGVVASDLFF